MDVYEWRNGELLLISTGTDADQAYYSGNSVDGATVFMWTTKRIDPREIEDADGDIYAARVGGGFPLPPLPPPPCDVLADLCQGPGGAPIPAPVESDSPTDVGNRQDGRPPVVRVDGPSRRALRRAARTGVIALQVRTNRRGRLLAVARARVHPAKRGRGQVRRVAIERTIARRAGRHVLRLRLNRVARQTLRAHGHLRVVVRVDRPGAWAKRTAFVLRRRGR
jgi:hypothetical protein